MPNTNNAPVVSPEHGQAFRAGTIDRATLLQRLRADGEAIGCYTNITDDLIAAGVGVYFGRRGARAMGSGTQTPAR